MSTFTKTWFHRNTTWVRHGAKGRTCIKREHVSFDICDTKGRPIGCFVQIHKVMIYQGPDEQDEGRLVPVERLGEGYEVDVHITRNGIEYGGSKSQKWVKHESQALEFADKAVERCRLSSAKKFAK
jgi:hypothetical protein